MFFESRVERVPINGGTAESVPGTAIPDAWIASQPVDLSPDGKSLAFFIGLNQTNAYKIAVVPLDAGPHPKVRMLDAHAAVSGVGPRLTPDGKAFVYPIIKNGVGNLWLQPLDDSPGRQITNFKTNQITSFRWSPDGENIGVLTRRRIDADVVLLRESGSAAQ